MTENVLQFRRSRAARVTNVAGRGPRPPVVPLREGVIVSEDRLRSVIVSMLLAFDHTDQEARLGADVVLQVLGDGRA